jgi:hypothetical protein
MRQGSRNVADVAIESDDEARRAAEAIIADIGCGDIAAGQDFVSLYADRNDELWIGRFLTPLLTEALKRYNAGDVSPEAARLVAFARTLKGALAVRDAETAAATAERAAERRAATVVAIQPAPDIGARMTGIGLHGLPLPDDAMPDGDFHSRCHARGVDGVLHRAHAGSRLEARSQPFQSAHERPLNRAAAAVLLLTPGHPRPLHRDPDRSRD